MASTRRTQRHRQRHAGGKAAALTIAFACGPFMCADDFQEHRVQLSRR